MSDLKELIKKNEGLRLKPYRCSAGKLTIGYGRNLDDNGITEDEANIMLQNDIDVSLADLEDIFECNTSTRGYYINEVIPNCTENRIQALIDMMFNLGLMRFKGFKKMIEAIKKGDWETASKEALDSKWAKQVGIRAERDALMLKIG